MEINTSKIPIQVIIILNYLDEEEVYVGDEQQQVEDDGDGEF